MRFCVFAYAKKDREGELKSLDDLATITIAYLVVAGVTSFAFGYFFLHRSTIAPVALLGFSGSAVAALTSCLDRYANGFELDDGTKEPKEAKGETFNRRMSRWFFVRPFLGLIVAPVFYMGIPFFPEKTGSFFSSSDRVGFAAFMAGLLAKSVLDFIKGFFKNIFKA